MNFSPAFLQLLLQAQQASAAQQPNPEAALEAELARIQPAPTQPVAPPAAVGPDPAMMDLAQQVIATPVPSPNPLAETTAPGDADPLAEAQARYAAASAEFAETEQAAKKNAAEIDTNTKRWAEGEAAAKTAEAENKRIEAETLEKLEKINVQNDVRVAQTKTRTVEKAKELEEARQKFVMKGVEELRNLDREMAKIGALQAVGPSMAQSIAGAIAVFANELGASMNRRPGGQAAAILQNGIRERTERLKAQLETASVRGNLALARIQQGLKQFSDARDANTYIESLIQNAYAAQLTAVASQVKTPAVRQQLLTTASALDKEAQGKKGEVITKVAIQRQDSIDKAVGTSAAKLADAANALHVRSEFAKKRLYELPEFNALTGGDPRKAAEFRATANGLHTEGIELMRLLNEIDTVGRNWNVKKPLSTDAVRLEALVDAVSAQINVLRKMGVKNAHEDQRWQDTLGVAQRILSTPSQAGAAAKTIQETTESLLRGKLAGVGHKPDYSPLRIRTGVQQSVKGARSIK